MPKSNLADDMMDGVLPMVLGASLFCTGFWFVGEVFRGILKREPPRLTSDVAMALAVCGFCACGLINMFFRKRR